jgi:hypothetical protein
MPVDRPLDRAKKIGFFRRVQTASAPYVSYAVVMWVQPQSVSRVWVVDGLKHKFLGVHPGCRRSVHVTVIMERHPMLICVGLNYPLPPPSFLLRGGSLLKQPDLTCAHPTPDQPPSSLFFCHPTIPNPIPAPIFRPPHPPCLMPLNATPRQSFTAACRRALSRVYLDSSAAGWLVGRSVVGR